MTDAAILREIEETPTRPEDVRYLAGGDKGSYMQSIKRLEKEGRLYRKRWHGLTVYGVNWYPQGEENAA